VPPFSQDQIDVLNELPRYLQPLGKAFNYTPGDGGGDGLGDLLAAGGSSVGALDDLTDVTLLGLANNNFLLYDSGTSQWTNRTVAAVVSILGGAMTFNDLSDVVLTAPAANNIVIYNGTNWVNTTLSTLANFVLALNDLSDVVIAAAANDDFLKHDGTNWIDFPLFATANTWTATQNTQSLIPTTNSTFDLGSSTLGYRTIYADNDGGVVFQLPTAAGTGSPTDYTLNLGGGGGTGEGGAVTIALNDTTPGTGATNSFILDLGAINGTGTANAFSMRSDVGGTLGLVSFDLQFGQGVPSTRLNFELGSEDSGTGTADTSITLGFVNATPGNNDTSSRDLRFSHRDNSGTLHDHLILSQRSVSVGAFSSLVNFSAPSANAAWTGGAASHGLAFVTFRGPGTTAPSILPASARARLSNVEIRPPSTATAVTITNAASLYITAAPTVGTNNYAFWVDAGNARYDGSLILTSGSTDGVTLSGDGNGLFTMASVGNTNNENLTFDLESVSNQVTIASGTSVSTLILNIATTRMTNAVVTTNLDFNASGDGVRLSGTTAGVLTMASVGNTNNENLTWDLEGTPNVVTLASGTGVANLIMSGISLNLNSTGVRLSGASGVFTILGLGGTPEDITFDLNTSDTITVASTTTVGNLVFNYGNVRTTSALEIDGDLNHDGSNIAFFNAAGSTQRGPYTPTNVTTDRSFDADTVAIAELADVVGTLIADLQAYGLIS
jgi:hypothetical protein